VAKSSPLRAARGPEKPKIQKTKTAVSLSDEAIKRLGAACVLHGVDQSDIVEWLIQENLSGYVIQVRGPRIPIGKSEGQPNLSVPAMADGSADVETEMNPPASLAG
jgi:hypothetical protein